MSVPGMRGHWDAQESGEHRAPQAGTHRLGGHRARVGRAEQNHLVPMRLAEPFAKGILTSTPASMLRPV